MTVVNVRTQLGFVALAMLLAGEAAQAQPASFQGAWLEEGASCASVFVAGRNGLAFRKPASALTPAFIISGHRLSTALATCRIARSQKSGERYVMGLSCTTSVATDNARAILSAAEGGGLQRYLAPEGGISAKYQRCRPEDLREAEAPKTR